MQIVINIDDNIAHGIIEGQNDEPRKIVRNFQATIADAIKNGTPLPKGHGRILDEKDILNTENNDGGWYDLVDMLEYIAGVKAIIEASSKED
jgi:hypothetical protein